MTHALLPDFAVIRVTSVMSVMRPRVGGHRDGYTLTAAPHPLRPSSHGAIAILQVITILNFLQSRYPAPGEGHAVRLYNELRKILRRAPWVP